MRSVLSNQLYLCRSNSRPGFAGGPADTPTLGHVFNNTHGRNPMGAMRAGILQNRNSIMCNTNEWVFNREQSQTETFADMFVLLGMGTLGEEGLGTLQT